MASFEKIILVTQHTRLDGLIRKFNTKGQAKFYLEHSGGDFKSYEEEHSAYHEALDTLRRSLDFGIPIQQIEKGLLANYMFQKSDLIVTLGRDGLVANTAKYVGSQPIVAVNPDPTRIDGVLLPFLPTKVRHSLDNLFSEKASVRKVTMAEVELNDGQSLLAFNDLFIGASSHVSARYQLHFQGQSEHQSSSGVIVSTGAGSTGWLSSVFHMAHGLAEFTGGEIGTPPSLTWEDPRLVYVTREPFVSRHSSADLVAGEISPGEDLVVESSMPEGGVIFSDGIAKDYLSFCAGTKATIRAAKQQACLVVG